jgi:hypothetical protein
LPAPVTSAARERAFGVPVAGGSTIETAMIDGSWARSEGSGQGLEQPLRAGLQV